MMHAPDLPRGINETNEKTTYLLGGWVYVILTSTHLPTYLPTCGWSALLPVGRSLPCRQKVNRPAAPNKGSHGTAAVQHLQYSTYRPAPRPWPCAAARRAWLVRWYAYLRGCGAGTGRAWRGWCSLTRKAGDLFRFPTVHATIDTCCNLGTAESVHVICCFWSD